jgi:hypothetical protein
LEHVEDPDPSRLRGNPPEGQQFAFGQITSAVGLPWGDEQVNRIAADLYDRVDHLLETRPPLSPFQAGEPLLRNPRAICPGFLSAGQTHTDRTEVLGKVGGVHLANVSSGI